MRRQLYLFDIGELYQALDGYAARWLRYHRAPKGVSVDRSVLIENWIRHHLYEYHFFLLTPTQRKLPEWSELHNEFYNRLPRLTHRLYRILTFGDSCRLEPGIWTVKVDDRDLILERVS